MRYPRHGHHVTSFADNYFVVTGSRKDTNDASNKCELYDIQKNQITALANMRNGRHYHSSCEFNGEWVYVICGIKNSTKKYFSSIERLNVRNTINNFNEQWQDVHLKTNAGIAMEIPARQGNGSTQCNADSIIILGGFGGKFFKDSWVINTNTNVVSQTSDQPSTELFPFAMPTVYDSQSDSVLTVCWK